MKEIIGCFILSFGFAIFSSFIFSIGKLKEATTFLSITPTISYILIIGIVGGFFIYGLFWGNDNMIPKEEKKK